MRSGASASRRGTRRAPVLRPRPPCEAGRQPQRWRCGRTFTGAGSGSSGLHEGQRKARVHVHKRRHATDNTRPAPACDARAAGRERALGLAPPRCVLVLAVRARKSSTTTSTTPPLWESSTARTVTSTAPCFARRGKDKQVPNHSLPIDHGAGTLPSRRSTKLTSGFLRFCGSIPHRPFGPGGFPVFPLEVADLLSAAKAVGCRRRPPTRYATPSHRLGACLPNCCTKRRVVEWRASTLTQPT